MLRILTFAVLVALIAVASSLYSLAQNVQQQERRAARLNAEIAREENAIRVLQAEWAYLNQPSRLQDLSMRFLDLKPVTARQIADLTELPTPVITSAAADGTKPAASAILPQPASRQGNAARREQQ